MKTVPICTESKEVKEYTIHKFSPIDGRGIVFGYPLSILSKEYSYAKNEEAMRKLFGYVSVTVDDVEVRLLTDSLIEQHIPDWWSLVQLEYQVLKYNCSFLENMDIKEVVSGTVKEYMMSMIKELIDSKKDAAPEEPQLNILG